MKYGKSSPTISAKPDGVGAASQRSIRKGRSAATEGTSSIHADYGEVESAIHKAKTRFGRKSPKAIIAATGNANHKVEKGSPTPTPDLVTDTSSK